MTGPLHIVFVDDYVHAAIGGGEQHLLRLARGCSAWGYRVSVVCVSGSGLEERSRAEGYDVWPILGGHHLLRDRRALAKLFAELAPDIVHTHGFYMMLAASHAAKRAGVGTVLVTVHNMPSAPLELKPGMAGRLEFAVRSALFRRAASSVDRFVCVVDAARRELVGVGVDASKLVLIENGIEDPVLGLGTSVRSGDDRVLAGSAGRLETLKGYEYLVSAAALVAAKASDVRFRLVGDGGLRDALEAQVAHSGLSARFEFAGWSPHPLDEISAMDIYVVSSVTDTTNLTILEAMGLSKPVIATDVGGISEEVTDGASGYVVPPRRADLLARRIVELAGDPALRASMGAEGRRRFEALFTEERMLERHRALYEGHSGARGESLSRLARRRSSPAGGR